MKQAVEILQSHPLALCTLGFLSAMSFGLVKLAALFQAHLG